MAVTQAFPKDLRAAIPGLPAHVDNIALTGAGAAVSFTVPTGAVSVIFSPYPKSADFGVNTVGGTAARPSATVTNGSATFFNPVGLEGLTPAGALSFVAGTADVNVGLIWGRGDRLG